MKVLKLCVFGLVIGVLYSLFQGCGGGGGGGIAVSVFPGTTTVDANAGQDFSSTVTGASNTNVNWSVQEAGGGTISASGVYSAPAAAGTYHVVATSASDGTTKGTAAVTVTPGAANLAITGIAGSWSGHWIDNTFGTSGNATLVITVDQVAHTVKVVLHMDGPVLGGAFGADETFNGTYDANGVTILNQPSSAFGNVSLSGNSSGSLTAISTNVPNPVFKRLDYTATVTAATINGNFTVTFATGATAVGTVNFTKP